MSAIINVCGQQVHILDKMLNLMTSSYQSFMLNTYQCYFEMYKNMYMHHNWKYYIR